MTESKDILFLELTFPIEDQQNYTIESNVAAEKQLDVITEFLRRQIGAGKDENKPNDKEVYKIRLELDLQNDSFQCKDDTGNKGLRDGILMRVTGLMANKS